MINRECCVSVSEGSHSQIHNDSTWGGKTSIILQRQYDADDKSIAIVNRRGSCRERRPNPGIHHTYVIKQVARITSSPRRYVTAATPEHIMSISP